MKNTRFIIGIDTGGTFTDFVFYDKNTWRIHKVLSTPHDPACAVLQGLADITAGRACHIVHGSTVATNAILEKKGAKTALVTNAGFEDVIEIARQNRSRIYDLSYRKSPPLVPRELRFGVTGRVLSNGSIHEHPDPDEARGVAGKLREAGAESVAVCLLFSFLNPEHEKAVGRYLSKLGIPVSLSHEILSEYREYERTSTTVINAYVAPVMKRYLTALKSRLGSENTFRVMQSNGGSISADTAMKEPFKTILSGPAGGVVGAYEIGRLSGLTRLITFDMGGTSTDVSLIDGKPSFSHESGITEYPVRAPMIDIHTVGSGGGSIAALDSGGALTVGPESAGADPGPICYGRGNRITVTDANLYLGRLIPEQFLGGSLRLHRDRLEPVFQSMARSLGISAYQLSEGILEVANTHMEKAIRVISVERGYDPREFTLFAFGGAGGLHAAFLAKLLSIPRVLIPLNPGILSATGMLLSDIIRDHSLTVMSDPAATGSSALNAAFSRMEKAASRQMAADGIPPQEISFERYLDMRYKGQSYELTVPFCRDYTESFHRLHEKTYGYKTESVSTEIVTVRIRALVSPEKPQFALSQHESKDIPAHAVLQRRDVFFEGRSCTSTVYRREHLVCGNTVCGPAVITEYSSTVVVPPFARARVDHAGNLVMTIL